MEMVRIVMSVILGIAAFLLLIAVPTKDSDWGIVFITKVLGLFLFWLCVKINGADEEYVEDDRNGCEDEYGDEVV